MDLILMNLNKSYNVLCLTFHASWTTWKDDGKDYTFDPFFGLLIKEHEKFLDEGKVEVKKHSHLMKDKIR